MSKSPSKSAANRQTGKHQVDVQRACILDAAENLFLQNGLESASMVDIASAAGITRVTLYRYFANKDEIAVEIQVRMLNKIHHFAGTGEIDNTLAGLKQRVRVTIRNFPKLREAYRYIGMFDKIYLDNAPENALAQWTKAQLVEGDFGKRRSPGSRPDSPYTKELPVIMNTITWFLEKLALRGELTWADPSIPLEDHLKFFEEMIMRSFDQLEEKKGRKD